LCRWVVGPAINYPVWRHPTFTKNWDRLLEAVIAHRCFHEVVEQARGAECCPTNSSVSRLIRVWVATRRFRPKDGGGSSQSHSWLHPPKGLPREKHGNVTEGSQTEPQVRLFRKSRGQEAQVWYQSDIAKYHLARRPAGRLSRRTARFC
jgi:hypothetical protein